MQSGAPPSCAVSSKSDQAEGREGPSQCAAHTACCQHLHTVGHLLPPFMQSCRTGGLWGPASLLQLKWKVKGRFSFHGRWHMALLTLHLAFPLSSVSRRDPAESTEVGLLPFRGRPLPCGGDGPRSTHQASWRLGQLHCSHVPNHAVMNMLMHLLCPVRGGASSGQV